MKKREKSKRELLFCVTQPVVDGWLTSTLVLQVDFTHDRSASHELRMVREARVSKAAEAVVEGLPPERVRPDTSRQVRMPFWEEVEDDEEDVSDDEEEVDEEEEESCEE